MMKIGSWFNCLTNMEVRPSEKYETDKIDLIHHKIVWDEQKKMENDFKVNGVSFNARLEQIGIQLSALIDSYEEKGTSEKRLYYKYKRVREIQLY